MGIEVSNTYNTVTYRINSLSVSELQAFKASLAEIFRTPSFSLDQLVPNILSVVDQTRCLIQKNKKNCENSRFTPTKLDANFGFEKLIDWL